MDEVNDGNVPSVRIILRGLCEQKLSWMKGDLVIGYLLLMHRVIHTGVFCSGRTKS